MSSIFEYRVTKRRGSLEIGPLLTYLSRLLLHMLMTIDEARDIISAVVIKGAVPWDRARRWMFIIF